MKISVIIPSRSIDNLRVCMAAVRECEPDAEIIVPWDATRGNRPLNSVGGFHSAFVTAWISARVCNVKSDFVFSRNVNLGIHEAFRHPVTVDTTHYSLPVIENPNPDGVVLLNDDAILKTPGGFTRLAELAAQHEDIGIIAPVTNVTGQPLQMPKGVGLRKVPHIAFVAVYIPRRTIERVGLLDERFTSYGWEDNDYTHRVNLAGLKVCVYDHVFVDHGSLKSTFRGDPRKAADIRPGREIFREKWGFA